MPTPTPRLPLLVVNGLGGHAASWRRFTDAIGPTFDVRVVDLPGHGAVPPAADYHYDALVDHLGREARALERFVLMGHSVGAAVAWLYAARHPERVTRLILLEPAAPHQSAFRDGPPPEPEHPFTYASPEKVRQALAGFDPAATDADIRLEYRQRPDGRWEPDFDPAIFPALADDQRDRGAELFEELRRVRAPALIIRAGRSLLRPEQLQELADAMSEVRVAEIADAGHLVQREQPGELARLVRTFALADP